MDQGNGWLADAVLGAAAGAVAVWVLDRVDWFNFRHVDPEARRRTEAVRPGGMDPAHVAVDKVARTLGRELTPKQHHAAGQATHYAIGIAPAALYAVLRRKVPAIANGRGTLFGLAMFLLQDEGLNTVVGLSAKPDRYPWQAHARGLVGHLVYGAALETLLRLADRRLRMF